MCMELFLSSATARKQVMSYRADQGILACVFWEEKGQESKHLLPAVQEVVGSGTMNDVETITILSGPGSFTGLRVVASYVETVRALYPSIRVQEVHMGEVLHVLKKGDPEYLAFQVYPSDLFLFHADGSFLKRVQKADLDSLKGHVIEGMVLPEAEELLGIQSLDIKLLEESEVLREVLSCAKEVKGIFEPFYAKGANIHK